MKEYININSSSYLDVVWILLLIETGLKTIVGLGFLAKI